MTALGAAASPGADRITDRIAVRGLRVRGNHGVYDSERRDGQEFVVDVVLELDTRDAAQTDDVSATVHYGDLAVALAEIVAGPPVNLVETLAERLAERCLDQPRVQAVEVTVHKPQAPIPVPFADVAVTIRRTAPPEASSRLRPTETTNRSAT